MNLEVSTVNVLLVSLITLNAWQVSQLFALKVQLATLAAIVAALTNKKNEN